MYIKPGYAASAFSAQEILFVSTLRDHSKELLTSYYGRAGKQQFYRGNFQRI